MDPEYDLSDVHNIKMRQRTGTSKVIGSESVQVTAENGNISHEGTDILAGDDGVTINSKKYTWKPAYEQAGFYHSDSKGYSHTTVHQPKAGGIQTSGTLIFQSEDTSLIGAQIVADKVSNPNDGHFEARPAYTRVESESFTTKQGFLGSSSRKIEETRNLVNSTQIITNYFESAGAGECVLESVVLQAARASIEKNLVERTAYDTVSTRITDTSSGFFAPKIKEDPLVESLRGVQNVVNFGGDTIPTALNMVGATAQTLNHALTLMNLARNPNPFATLGSIFLSRYVAGFGYSNIKTTTTRHESAPHQSQIRVGVLRITNDRSHLEGIWDAPIKD